MQDITTQLYSRKMTGIPGISDDKGVVDTSLFYKEATEVALLPITSNKYPEQRYL